MPGKDDLVRGYAQALFSVADAEGALAKVENELFAFAKAMELHTDLRAALTDPALPAENKKAVIADLVGSRAHPVTSNLIGFLVESGRARELGGIIQQLAALAAERRQHALAEVRSAVPLTKAQRDRLQAALSRATGRTVEVKVVIDPSVVAGIVSRVGDEIFDGTVSSRLAEVKEQLGSA